MPERWLWWMVKISCRMAARSMLPLRPLRRPTHRTPRATKRLPRSGATLRRLTSMRGGGRKHRNPGIPQGSPNESIAAVYFAAGRHHTADGGDLVGGLRGLPAVARFGVTPSRLPNHSGADLLSGRQSGRYGFLGDRAAGAPVWPGSRPESDDFDKLLWQLDHHAAV